LRYVPGPSRVWSPRMVLPSNVFKSGAAMGAAAGVKRSLADTKPCKTAATPV
jgi:hypothetical protein